MQWRLVPSKFLLLYGHLHVGSETCIWEDQFEMVHFCDRNWFKSKDNKSFVFHKSRSSIEKRILGVARSPRAWQRFAIF
jgi:hypothetical protein